jgi:hypothetical protein
MVIFGEPQWGKIMDLPGIQDLILLHFMQNILIGVANSVSMNIHNHNQLTCK